MSARNLSHQRSKPYPQLEYEARPKHLESVRGRLGEFIGGHFADYNLSALLVAHRKDDLEHVKLEVYSPGGRAKPLFEEAKRGNYKPAKKGDWFGPSWSNHWFRVTLRIPKEWEDYERVQLEFDCGGEAMVFTTDGDPLQGLTGGHEGDRRVEFIISPEARKAGTAHYYIEASCNQMFGISHLDEPDPNRQFQLESADLVVPNMEAWRLMYDFDSINQLKDELPRDTPLSMKAQWVANEIMNVFKTGSLESVAACRKTAELVLGEAWQKQIQKEGEHADKQTGTLWGVGHCHIDTAWLWPFSVTQQKSARSWSTQLDLMDRYPEHRFSATQAQQFKWVEQQYPTLFSRIKQYTAEGRFQPVGATWVEMDCNMPNGEALVRQFLYGQRFYESRFGFRPVTFVLPDTFGYSSQLPQIARLAGCNNFFTQKMSWNNTNKFPHTSFNWVGLDNSQILTHLTPVNNYNSQCNMDDIRRGMTGHQNLEITSQSLLLYGNGDGGGGPTPPMLEKLRRARAVGKRHDAGGQLPLLKMGGSFDQFFESLREETHNGKMLPTWRGELYAEFHRATYTTHGSIKKGNRKSEIIMRVAEYSVFMASLQDSSFDYAKAKKRIDAAWEDLLLCQFHDVLPGSGIGMIYEDAEEKYAGIRKNMGEVMEEAYAILYPKSKPLTEETVAAEGTIFAVNTLPEYPRQAVMAVPTAQHKGLKSVSAQVSKDGKTGYVLVDASDSAECAVGRTKGMFADVQRASATQTGVDAFMLENGSLSVEIKDGRITSVYDKEAERELITEGQTAGMVIMEDHPNFWDAWDVDQFHLEKQNHLKFGNVRVMESGPLRAALGASLRIGQSLMEVEISVDAIAASLKKDARSLIRFSAVVDWREKHQFLKFEIPFDISAENAIYDTQFGVVARPTHRNTSWDAAKFEVCGHKFADLSEFGYGVAILNDCKYGYATEGNIMRLSLLRGPTSPDANCDMGTHRIQWAIYPHVGTFAESDVPQVATAFNMPMALRYTPEKVSFGPGSEKPMIGAPSARNVMIQAVKRGEDDVEKGETTLIVRLFEQFGGHAKGVTMKFSDMDVSSAELVNLLEDHVEILKMYPANKLSGNENAGENDFYIKLDFRGFEIKTVKLKLKNGGKKMSSTRRESGSWVKL